MAIVEEDFLESRKTALAAVSNETRMPSLWFKKMFFGRSSLPAGDLVRHDFVNLGSQAAYSGERNSLKDPRVIDKDDAESYIHKAFKIYEAKRLDPDDDALILNPGQTAYEASLSGGEFGREARAVMSLENRAARFCEKLAVKMALDGVFKSDDGNVEVDIERPARMNRTNSSSDFWSASAANIVEQCLEFVNVYQQNSAMTADTMVIGKNVFGPFMDNEKIRQMLDNRRYEVGNLTLDRLSPTVYYVGNIAPNLKVYLYLEVSRPHDGTNANSFTDSDFIFDVNKIVLGSSMSMGTSYFTPCKVQSGEKSSLIQAERVIDYYLDPPSKSYYIRYESHPLILPERKTSFLTAKVV